METPFISQYQPTLPAFSFCAYSGCNTHKHCPDFPDMAQWWLFSILTFLMFSRFSLTLSTPPNAAPMGSWSLSASAALCKDAFTWLKVSIVFPQPIPRSAARSKDISSTWVSPGWTRLPCNWVGAGRQELGLCCWTLPCPALFYSSCQIGRLSGKLLTFPHTHSMLLSHTLLSSFWKDIPTTTSCFTTPFPYPRYSRWCLVFHHCNSDVTHEQFHLSIFTCINRSAQLLIHPKTQDFLMRIQIFLVFILLELTQNNSLNTQKKICIWLNSGVAKQSRTTNE